MQRGLPLSTTRTCPQNQVCYRFFPALSLSLVFVCQSPRSERQTLEMQHLGLDVPEKCRSTKQHTQHVYSIVSIVDHLASSATSLTSFLFGLYCA